MIETAEAINVFALGGQAQPSDHTLITLTLGQLKDLVQAAVQQAIQPLQARVEQLEARIAQKPQNGPILGQDGQYIDLPEETGLKTILQPRLEGSGGQEAPQEPPHELEPLHDLRDRLEGLEAWSSAMSLRAQRLAERLEALEGTEPQPLQKDRGEILRALIMAHGGRMLAKDARLKMRLSKPLFSMLLKSMGDVIDKKPLHSDHRKLVLSLRPGVRTS